MLLIYARDDSAKLVGSRWIPAFAGMTTSRWIPAFAGMTTSRWIPAFAGMTRLKGLRVSSQIVHRLWPILLEQP
jgi:hypothetical protein